MDNPKGFRRGPNVEALVSTLKGILDDQRMMMIGDPGTPGDYLLIYRLNTTTPRASEMCKLVTEVDSALHCLITHVATEQITGLPEDVGDILEEGQ